MKNVISILLIAASVLVGYQGVVILTDAYKTIRIGDLSLSASKKSEKKEGYIYLGGAAVLLLGGTFLMNRKP